MTDLPFGTTPVSLTANVTAARVAAPELPSVRVEKGIAVRLSALPALKKLRHRRMDSNSVLRVAARESLCRANPNARNSFTAHAETSNRIAQPPRLTPIAADRALYSSQSGHA